MSKPRFAVNVGNLVATKIKVSNLSWITGRDQLTTYFSNFGKVEGVYVPLDVGGFNKSIAYVWLDKAEDVKKLLSTQTKHKLDHRIIQIEQGFYPPWKVEL